MFSIDNIPNQQIGVVAEEETFIAIAPIVYDEIQIDGMHGSEFVEKNRGNSTGSITLFVLDTDKLDSIKTYFSGKHTLSYQGRTTTIYFYDLTEIERFGQKKKMTVNFIRNPFWYKDNDDYVKYTTYINNVGNQTSLPIIKLVGSGVVDITIAGVRFKYDFKTDTEVIIDCKDKTETFKNQNRSLQMQIGFEYPSLKVGRNSITIHGGTVEIFVKRKDCWL